MTDTNPPGRIDLRALDEHMNSGRVGGIIGVAIERAGVRRRVPTDELSRIATIARPVLAAAALVMLAAATVIRLTARASAGPPLGSLASWVDEQRVPTNGEVLAAFGGYGR